MVVPSPVNHKNKDTLTMKTNTLTIGIIVAIALVAINGCSTYNSLVSMSEGVDQAWAKVENQYQRRLDLIPNLVNTVKGYAKHESETLQSVTNARTGLTEAYNKANGLKEGANATEESLQQYSGAQNELNRALSVYVNAVHEAYPDLKANENFRDLQTQLEGTENRIATERKDYTEQVQQYNIAVRRFPATIWAGMFGFTAKPQFKAEEGASKAQRVEF